MTTILCVRRDNQVVIGGDGQVSLGNTIMKGNARKVRRLYKNQVIAGFAGGTADAFTLFERFEAKLEAHNGQLTRAAVELAKDWRTDRSLRRLEALLAVADKEASLIISGTDGSGLNTLAVIYKSPNIFASVKVITRRMSRDARLSPMLLMHWHKVTALW